MQIVIDIPDEIYKKYIDEFTGTTDVLHAVRRGTPLPKGHGRLIDADELKRTMEKDKRRALSFVDLTDFVWLAPTIIEADKGSKRMIVWMQVTKDEYELPVAIADSCKELAEIVGKTSNTVSSSITHSKERGNWTPYRKVEIDDED